MFPGVYLLIDPGVFQELAEYLEIGKMTVPTPIYTFIDLQSPFWIHKLEHYKVMDVMRKSHNIFSRIHIKTVEELLAFRK